MTESRRSPGTVPVKDTGALWVVILPLLKRLNLMPGCIRSRHVTNLDKILLVKLAALVGVEIVDVDDMDFDEYLYYVGRIYGAVGSYQFGPDWIPELKKEDNLMREMLKDVPRKKVKMIRRKKEAKK